MRVAELLAYLAPLLALAVALLLGRYPGERALRRRLARRADRPRRARTLPLPRPYPRRPLPRGGALLASGLAGRAPPVSAASPN
jgi:hypothetical protein